MTVSRDSSLRGEVPTLYSPPFSRHRSNRGRRQSSSIDDRHDDRCRQLADSGLAASEAADRVIRELDWTSPKRPDRGVPPPRSGLPPFGVT
jgi:hypothetical protein